MHTALVPLCINHHTTFSFTNSKDMTGAKFKWGHLILTTPIRASSVIARIALDIFYLQNLGVETENGSCDPNHAP